MTLMKTHLYDTREHISLFVHPEGGTSGKVDIRERRAGVGGVRETSLDWEEEGDDREGDLGTEVEVYEEERMMSADLLK
jgi:hypothetical protein